jgi:hypothetical protein
MGRPGGAHTRTQRLAAVRRMLVFRDLTQTLEEQPGLGSARAERITKLPTPRDRQVYKRVPSNSWSPPAFLGVCTWSDAETWRHLRFIEESAIAQRSRLDSWSDGRATTRLPTGWRRPGLQRCPSPAPDGHASLKRSGQVLMRQLNCRSRSRRFVSSEASSVPGARAEPCGPVRSGGHNSVCDEVACICAGSCLPTSHRIKALLASVLTIPRFGATTCTAHAEYAMNTRVVRSDLDPAA